MNKIMINVGNNSSTSILIAKIIVLSLVLITPLYASVPKVLVTIKPIHALVTGVMDGIETPYLLLSGSQSPHNYNLYPSQVRQLHAANLIVWVGPLVESFLTKALTTVSDNSQILRLIDISGLKLLQIRKNWETHHEHNGKFKIDPHIWLTPDNAKIIVQTVAKTLVQIDPNNATQYTNNAARLIERLSQLDQTLTQRLKPIQKLPYLIFHDAYQYFENKYKLNAKGAIKLSPEIRPSVKRLHKLRLQIKNQQIRCIFSEPQFESSLITTLTEGTTIQYGVLDPLGINLTSGTESYFTLLNDMATSLQQCLQPK
ncbi:MAG: zinc ABC transporter substrate-binding protein [Candidatus Marithrix sp.]|nr:zinc ABC transporter substrate-binding protein [Candidatus Marithrix sp.]